MKVLPSMTLNPAKYDGKILLFLPSMTLNPAKYDGKIFFQSVVIGVGVQRENILPLPGGSDHALKVFD